MNFKIACWNVNSLPARIDLIKHFLGNYSIDILILQEIKTQTENFPYDFFSDYKYDIKVYGQKTFNGVAIFSKYKIEEVIFGSEVFLNDPQARYIEVVININNSIIRVANVYVPNGMEIGSEKFEYKLQFLNHLHSHLQKVMNYNEKFVIGGDWNVAPEAIDVYDPEMLKNKIGFHYLEQRAIYQIMNLNLLDGFRILNSTAKQYSWWDYRANGFKKNYGMRIDYLLFNPQMLDNLQDIEYCNDYRAKDRPSDHIPVIATLNFKG